MLRTLLLLCLAGLFTTIAAQSAKISPDLRSELAATNQVQAIVVLTRQPGADLVKAARDRANRGSFVYASLRDLAQRTQAGMLRQLTAEQREFRSFTIVNAIYLLRADAELLERLAARPEVARIIANPWTEQDLGRVERAYGAARSTVEWGVARIGAPELWNLGFRGEGMTVGGQDTGYDWQHPALRAAYRGTQADTVIHDYNWHDAIHMLNPLNNGGTNSCGFDSPQPCDDGSHGTHTMGTMVGDDGAGNQVGVAPGARWIGCRNMERGYGSPASYIECFDWFLAPTRVDGTDPDPTRRPDVIANSWSCPPLEGCNPDNFALMQLAIENLRAAGTVVVTSAGNSGPACSTIDTPPSIFAAAFPVGATNDQDSIAGFSSRGPITIDGSGRLAPQVAAPGVNVRSSVTGGGYANFSGTSMAGPHVAGAVAVLLSALPELRGRVNDTEAIFKDSALPLFSAQNCGNFPGSVSPNAVYGHGRIDLVSAYERGQTVLSITGRAAAALVAVRAYPNPTTGLLTLEWTEERPPVALRVLDLSGREVRRQTPGNTPYRVQFSLAGLPAGVYTWQLRFMDGNMGVGRVVLR
ncbi:MAG: S8 family serine peptidase [Saprospiraceae bacterium]